VHTRLTATRLPPRDPHLGAHDDQVRRHPAGEGDERRVEAGDEHHHQGDVEGDDAGLQRPEPPRRVAVLRRPVTEPRVAGGL
jgi:hypothetical protein